MLSSLIDLKKPSKISFERRENLNQLAILAAKSEGPITEQTGCLETLLGECYRMVDVYQEITHIGDISEDFFRNIDIAFKKAMPTNPEVFDTYVQLT